MPRVYLADLIGKPFCDFGRGPDCYDCWGLAKEVFERYGMEMPDFGISCKDHRGVSKLIHGQEHAWLPQKTPAEPCICIFCTSALDPSLVSHMGVFIGDGRFIHAAEKHGVITTALNHPYWKRVVYGFYVPMSTGGESA